MDVTDLERGQFPLGSPAPYLEWAAMKDPFGNASALARIRSERVRIDAISMSWFVRPDLVLERPRPCEALPCERPGRRAAPFGG